jgi:ABC-type multidrug transport system fused ATPase/permease subunit
LVALINVVMNRFSGDINIIDEVLPAVMQSFCNCAFQVMAVVAVICWVTPVYIVLLVPLYKLYSYTQGHYIRSARELKRIESSLRSPVMSHFAGDCAVPGRSSPSGLFGGGVPPRCRTDRAFAVFAETLDGLSTIRAYGLQQNFIDTLDQKNDASLKAYFPSVSANRWLAMRTEFIGTTTVASAAILVVLGRADISPGLSGLSVTYALVRRAQTVWSTLHCSCV